MTRRVLSVAPKMTVGDLYRLFAMDDHDAYPVVRSNTVIRKDVMRALGRCTQRQAPPLVPCETVRCLPLA